MLISDYVRTGVSLIRHGVTPTTLLLWPLRLHRRHPWKQIDLKHGVSMISPPEEPLVGMFREIWINHLRLRLSTMASSYSTDSISMERE